DEARGPARAKAGLIWHLVGGEEVAAGHFRLRGGDAPVEVHLVSSDDVRMVARRYEESMVGWEMRCYGSSELYAVVSLIRERFIKNNKYIAGKPE
ncbi:MAG: hypothetical protein QXP27_03305, partial [Candidatus Methanomethyliaceae archaeon]